ncbi:MAG: hypothetical protein HN646_09510 [Nitrospina sp.]|nr:hypothetical protein [Nitrospina sp.]
MYKRRSSGGSSANPGTLNQITRRRATHRRKPKNKFPLLTKDDEDYVVYLSRKSPMDINEKKG